MKSAGDLQFRTLAAWTVAVAIVVVPALGWASSRAHGPDVPVPVLLYHEITPGPVSDRGMVVTASEFEAHMKALKEHGYTAITLEELLSDMSGRGSLPLRPVLITFDDGYESVYKYAYPVLRKNGMRAAAFVVGSTIGTPNHLSPAEISEMIASGVVEVGSHTYGGHGGTSSDPHIASWTLEQLDADFSEMAAFLRKHSVRSVPALAYPFGKVTRAIVQAARRSGFLAGFTTREGAASWDDSPMLLPRITVWPGNDGAALLAKIQRALSYVPLRRNLDPVTSDADSLRGW